MGHREGTGLEAGLVLGGWSSTPLGQSHQGRGEEAQYQLS